MSSELSWEAFQEFFIQPGKPKAIRLKGNVPATLFVGEMGRSMGIRLPAEEGVAALRSPMRQISFEVRGRGAGATFELSTAANALYKEFFLFSMDVADAVQRQGVGVAEAIESTLRSWRELLQRAARLSPEAEVGLLGELLTLQRLIEYTRSSAVDSWTGPLLERHDFRLNGIEIEVKTTVTASREHFINSWEQLLPGPGMSLYLLSIQLERAGSAKGFSLPSLVEELKSELEAAPRALLLQRLDNVGYLEADAAQYPDRYKKRSPDRLILVDAAFPRLVKASLKLPESIRRRFRDIHYRIDVDGLGVAETSAKFWKVLPSRKAQ